MERLMSEDFDYPNLVGGLGDEERLRFDEILSSNLTVTVRAIWSDENLSDAEKVEGMRWVNEIMHQVLQKSAALRSGWNNRSEAETWESVKFYVSLCPHISDGVGRAVKVSYEYCRR